MNILLPIWLATAALLVACNSDSGSKQTTSTDSTGIVADGYLENAFVCLDINANLQCDANEPNDVTDANGSYFLDTDELDQYSVFVEVGTDAIDSDTSTNVENAYVLTAPVGKHEFVSPITTLIQLKLLADSSLTLSNIEAELAAVLGLSDSDELYADFISDSELETIHLVAQVIASAMGSALHSFENSSVYTADDRQAVIEIIGELIDDNIEGVVYSVKQSIEDGDEINPIALASYYFEYQIIAMTLYLDVLLDFNAQIENATSIAAKSVYESGFWEMEFYLSYQEQDGVVLQSMIRDENDFYTNIEDDVIQSTSCDLEYNFITGVADEEECETKIGYIGTYVRDDTRWILNDDNLLVEATYNGYSFYSRWLNDSTRQDVYEYLYNGEFVTQISKTSSVYALELDLEGRNIQDYVTDLQLLETLSEDGLNSRIESSDDLFNFTESSATFTAGSNAIVVTRINIEVDNLISSAEGTEEMIRNERYGGNISEELSLDVIIENDYKLEDECTLGYTSYRGCYIQFGATIEDDSGTALIIDADTVWDDDGTDSIEVLSSIDWMRGTLYGKDAIIFDMSTLQNGVSLWYWSAIIEIGDDQIFQIRPYIESESYDVVYFNDAAMTEIRAVFDEAVEDYKEAVQ